MENTAIVFYDSVEGTKGRISLIHFQKNLLSESMLSQGIEVQVANIPTPENISGKGPVLYIDTVTKEITIEYIDRPLTVDEELAKVKTEMTDMQVAINMALGL